MHTDLTTSFVGIFSLLLFVVAYVAIAFEERIHIAKSKPALFAGTGMFMLIGAHFALSGLNMAPVEAALHEVIFETASLFFFLYVAMVYIEVITERGAFDALRFALTSRGYSYKKIYWIIGVLAFVIGSVAGNLTTALVLASLLLAIDKHNKPFLITSSVNIVVASNAGGVFSPFGNVTTLMAWVAGKAGFTDFLALFPAGIVGWLVSAFILSKFIPSGFPHAEKSSESTMKEGAFGVIVLGMVTIAMAVVSSQVMSLPAVWGMMFGLSLLNIYAFALKKRKGHDLAIFDAVGRIENDTLLFFFGLMSAIGALSFLGYLAVIAGMYQVIDQTAMNIGVGITSAILDNVPLMYAIIKANPAMSDAQWLLVTLTIGIGGSLISIGSAAGVAIMGRLKGIYTFGAHLKYAWVVAVGYVVSIAVWYVQFEILKLY